MFVSCESIDPELTSKHFYDALSAHANTNHIYFRFTQFTFGRIEGKRQNFKGKV